MSLMPCIDKVHQFLFYVSCKMSGSLFYEAGTLKDCLTFCWFISHFPVSPAMPVHTAYHQAVQARAVSCPSGKPTPLVVSSMHIILLKQIGVSRIRCVSWLKEVLSLLKHLNAIFYRSLKIEKNTCSHEIYLDTCRKPN